jgi:hypothetical protein
MLTMALNPERTPVAPSHRSSANTTPHITTPWMMAS